MRKKPTTIERACARCGAPFILTAPRQTYCTDPCRRAARREYIAITMRIRRGSQIDTPVVSRPYRNRIDVTCEHCGQVRSKPASWANRIQRHFCGVACARQASIKPLPNGTCVVCGKSFPAPQYMLDRGRQLCGRTCQGRWAADRSTLERLHKDTVRLPNGCLIRTGRLLPSGYSNIEWRGRRMGAHVLAYLLANGLEAKPKGMDICHTCPGGDNKACIEPTHLSLDTRSKNMQQASQRGSIPSKLNPDKVREMRRIYATERITWAALGERFGVSDMAARSAVLRLTWAWVE